MEVTGSLSLLRAKYVKGTFNETQIICVDGADRGLPSTACVGQNATGTLKPFDVDRSGEKIPQAPRLTWNRSEEHTSELQSLMRISYAVFCLQKKKKKIT